MLRVRLLFSKILPFVLIFALLKNLHKVAVSVKKKNSDRFRENVKVFAKKRVQESAYYCVG
jgi:hypothetical protein